MPPATAIQAITPPRVELIQTDPIHAIAAYAAEPDRYERGLIYKRELSPLIAKGEGLIGLRGWRKTLDPVKASNAFGTLVGNVVTQRTLELLRVQLPTLSRISTDMSDESVKYGVTVYSRVVGIPTVGTYSTSTGYPDAETEAETDVPVIMNAHKCVSLALNAETIGGTARNIFDELAPANAYALGKDLVDAVYALITAANFTNTATERAAAEFGRDTVIDIAKALTARGVPMGSGFRTLLLNQDYSAALAKDPTVSLLAVYQQPGIITEGNLPNVHGFVPIEASNLPTTGNLAGFGFSKSALLAVTRVPADYTRILPGAAYGNAQVITDPDTGASLLQVDFVDHNLGTATRRVAWQYGVAKGQINAGQRLISAQP
jgi:hypothetical protein